MLGLIARRDYPERAGQSVELRRAKLANQVIMTASAFYSSADSIRAPQRLRPVIESWQD
jgi:hypothetical protein